MSTLTAANSVLTLVCPDVFPVGQLIQGYSAEDAFSVPQYETAQTRMSVDAIMSAGFVPSTKELDIVLQADSASRFVFQRILGVMTARREVVYMDVNIILPATNEIWELTRGVITKTPALPAVRRLLEPVTWQITFQDIQPAGF